MCTIPKAPNLSVLNNARTPLEERIAMATQYVCQLAALPNCPIKTSRRGGMSQCTCLHDRFFEQDTDALAKRLSSAIVTFSCLNRDRRCEHLMVVIRYSRMPFFGNNRTARKFALPEEYFDDDDGDDDTSPTTSPYPICQSALMAILGVGTSGWKTVSNAATTSILPRHGLTGKQSNRALDAGTTSSLKQK